MNHHSISQRPQINAMSWIAEGACHSDPDVQSEWFFPTTKVPSQDPNFSTVMQLCATCPVRELCFQHAVDSEPYGLWGGSTEREREAIRYYLGRPLQMVAQSGQARRAASFAVGEAVDKFGRMLRPDQRPPRRIVA